MTATPASSAFELIGWRRFCRSRLAEPVDPASVVVFRMAFGVLIVWEAWRYFQNGWIEQLYLRPGYLFAYPGFEWVAPWPGIGLHLHFFGIGFLGACIAIGIWQRAACVLLFAALWYVVLLDKAAYLNHLYLAALLAGLMAVVPAGRALQSQQLPGWCLWLLRFQIALPYIFGGVAKLNADWLAGQPMGLWLSRMSDLAPGVPFLDTPWAGIVVSYAALLFDLGVVPALMWKPTRGWAMAAAIGFHLLNAVMFRIGIFPWMMIAATTLFLPPDWPRRLLPGRLTVPHAGEHSNPARLPRRVVFGIVLWVSLQLVLPVRHLAFPGRVDWNEQGSRFAWRMMVRDKTGILQFVAVDPATGRRQAIDPRGILTAQQIERMGQYPDMLRQFAGFLSESLRVPGAAAPEVHVVSLVSLNGRKPQALVSPAIDLADPPAGTDWIVPLTEPLPDEPWLVPPPEWTSHVPLPVW